MSTKKTRAPSKNSNKNSKGSKDEVPTTSKDKSSTPSRSPDKDTSFRPTVSRDKDSLRPTVSVSREEFIALRDAVELLKNRSTPNSVQSGPSEKRSAAEAFDLDDTSVTVQSGPSKKRTAAEAFDLDDSESDNDRESFSDSESEFDQFFVQDDRCGDAINDKLAGKVNNALLVSPEKEMLTDLLAKHPRPKNVPNLKLPKVNNEVKIVNKPVKFREGRLGKAQNCVEKGLTVVLQIFSKSKLAKGKNPKFLMQMKHTQRHQMPPNYLSRYTKNSLSFVGRTCAPLFPIRTVTSAMRSFMKKLKIMSCCLVKTLQKRLRK